MPKFRVKALRILSNEVFQIIEAETANQAIQQIESGFKVEKSQKQAKDTKDHLMSYGKLEVQVTFISKIEKDSDPT